MPNRSAKFLLIEARLGSDLGGYIRGRRPDTSYENIARDLWVTTGVDVTAQTIANWDDAGWCLSPTDDDEAVA